MRVTVCELPHEPDSLAIAWERLRMHTAQQGSELVLLPEFAFVQPVWQQEGFDTLQWARGIAATQKWLTRLDDLGAPHVVSTWPVTVGRRHYNEGFLWSKTAGLVPLRRKYFLPSEPGGWEAHWFARGDRDFPRYTAGEMSFGLNICTELWALDTYASYAAMRINAVLCPRATSAGTAARWISAGTVAAVRSGAYCLSSNRVHPDGSCGGRGWIVSPDGDVLATTSRDEPFCTVAIDLGLVQTAAKTYPRYVFAPDR